MTQTQSFEDWQQAEWARLDAAIEDANPGPGREEDE